MKTTTYWNTQELGDLRNKIASDLKNKIASDAPKPLMGIKDLGLAWACNNDAFRDKEFITNRNTPFGTCQRGPQQSLHGQATAEYSDD